ncbi:MAG TPA: PKD domain-containing protein, partial [Burkholderiales bacterium]|nr:PKD domain-containing protein [Burkholderiales bacterium]
MQTIRIPAFASPRRGALGALLVAALLVLATGGAQATGTRGTQVDNYCAAKAPASSAPQQSRPYRASGNSCAYCHPAGGGNNAGNLNQVGRDSASCSSTNCAASVDNDCINTPPRSEAITAPTGNVSVGTGTAVSFAGSAIDPDGFPLTFTWRFSNGLPDVNTTGTATGNAQTSSTNVTFANAGTVTTTFQVRDPNQTLAATQPTRQVTVTAPANQAPNGTIDSPAANVSVVQGGTVNFQGTGTDFESSTLTYLWNFGGGAPNSTLQDPGNVTFNTVGTFNVSFTVTDAQGLADPTPATRTVTVTAPPALAIAPTSVSVAVGSTATSTVSNAVGAVTATSANTSIATASVSGNVVTVTGVAAGSTTVAVRDSRTNAVTQTLSVTVNAAPLAISPASVSVAVGASATSTVSNAVGAITATSANTAIATASVVNNSVIVSGVAAGSTTIAVRDSRTAVQTLGVTVNAPVLQGCRDNDRDG